MHPEDEAPSRRYAAEATTSLTLGAGDAYTIADIALWPRYGALVGSRIYLTALTRIFVDTVFASYRARRKREGGDGRAECG